MNLKEVAVYVDHDAEMPLRVKFAQFVARQQQATLTGLYLRRPHRSMKYYATYIPADVVLQLENAADLKENEARDAFFAATGARARANWRSYPASPEGRLEVQCRCFDLLILPTLSPRDAHLNEAYDSDSLILSAGCPILFVNAFAGTGRKDSVAVVAWDGSREAARALHDAVPLLQHCSRSYVVTVGDVWVGQHRPADPSAYLEHHNVNAVTEHLQESKETGAEILKFAAEVDASLIVAGGYGRSRLGELVFGGVTRRLLTDATVPVLMSH